MDGVRQAFQPDQSGSKLSKLPHSNGDTILLLLNIPSLVEQSGSVDALALIDDLGDAFGSGDVFEGVTIYQQQISIAALLYRTDAALCAQQAGGSVSCSLESCRRRNAGTDPKLEFAVERRPVKHQQVAGVAACNQRDTCLIGSLQILLRLFQSRAKGFEPFEER